MPVSSPSRDDAVKSLEAFLPHAGADYTKNRNYDLGEGKHTNVSQLSPLLRRRLLHEREVIQATLEKHTFAAAEKFLQEVIWRTYWKGWLEMRPAVWESYKQQVLQSRESLLQRASLAEPYQKAVTGNTGIDCFDAWAKELVGTGYLHNHARMWFASIWIFTLQLPWELGADFFFQQLLDADPASNTLSWRWVAGLHTRGKHYLALADNIREFTHNRFLVNTPLAENASSLIETEHFEIEKLLFPAKQKFEDIALLIHAEHCVPEEFELYVEPSCIITVSDCPTPEFNYQRCERSLGFDRTSVLDAAQRAAEHYSCEHHDVTVKELQQEGHEYIVTPHAPLGDIQEGLLELGSALSKHNTNLIFMSDDWDETFYRFAKKGFFDFRNEVMVDEKTLRKLIA